jgi:CheY-like chemotaxis protein
VTKILVVEDDALNREMIMRRLKLEGFESVSAADGLQAVSVAQAEQPDLILMDMGLPVLNGWQATQRIKADSEMATIPVIALTAYAMREDYAQCLAAGCDEFETKPIDFPRLFRKMRLLLDHRAAARSSMSG